MSDFLSGEKLVVYLVPLLLAVFMLMALQVYRYRASRRLTLSRVVNEIAFERVDGLVIPSTDDGVIQVDQLLLTAQGILILDIKDVHGVVFGSDKMQEWTVINENRRFTFPNPQPALFDRIAAVRNIVRGVPVMGRILFLEGAKFTKGIPEFACSLQELLDVFSDADKATARIKIEAFRQHWEVLNGKAVSNSE